MYGANVAFIAIDVVLIAYAVMDAFLVYWLFTQLFKSAIASISLFPLLAKCVKTRLSGYWQRGIFQFSLFVKSHIPLLR